MRWMAVLALAAVVSASSCTRSRGPNELPYPVEHASIAGPGSELLDGFSVQEGSWLLGAPFPRHHVVTDPAAPGRIVNESYGWDAVLALTGDPRRVAQRYLDLALRVGFEDATAHVRCESNDRCDAQATTRFEGGEEHTFGVSALRSESKLDGYPSVFVRLTVAGLRQGPLLTATDAAATKARPKATPRFHEGRLSGEGDDFGNIRFPLGDQKRVSFVVEPGSRLVAPSQHDHLAGDLGPAMIAVVKLGRDDDALIARYVRQSRAFYPDGAWTDTWELSGGVKVVQHKSFCGGGCGRFDAVFIEWSDGSTYGLMSASTRS